MTDFTGAARRMTYADIENAAKMLGCEVAALRAVMAVESRNSGFDAKKRPIILFEPHVFHRNLPAGSVELAAAVAAGLAYPEWRKGNYPKGSAIEQSDGNYARLVRAIAIDEEAAYRAVSIGMGQVLGENFRVAGCSSAKDMFEAATDSEAAQLGHMIGFIREKRIDDDLRRKNWETFARVYNGKGQVEKYASWLAHEYKKWAAISTKPREELTARDLREAGSRTIAGADQVKSGLATASATVAGAGALASQVQDITGQMQSAAESAQSAAGALAWAQGHWKLLALAALLGLAAWAAWRIWRGASLVQHARVDDANSGLNIGR